MFTERRIGVVFYFLDVAGKRCLAVFKMKEIKKFVEGMKSFFHRPQVVY